MAENKGNRWLRITEIIRGVIIISRVFKVFWMCNVIRNQTSPNFFARSLMIAR